MLCIYQGIPHNPNGALTMVLTQNFCLVFDAGIWLRYVAIMLNLHVKLRLI